jgi:hypothetical protein
MIPVSPERGTCPLCKRDVSGVRMDDGSWLPVQNHEHEPNCANARRPLRAAAAVCEDEQELRLRLQADNAREHMEQVAKVGTGDELRAAIKLYTDAADVYLDALQAALEARRRDGGSL